MGRREETSQRDRSERCAHTERLHSYIKCSVGSRCHHHGQERSSSKEKEREEEKEEGGQRRRRWRTKRKMKKEKTVCMPVIISIQTHTITCFVSEADFPVQPPPAEALTAPVGRCVLWALWHPSIIHQGHGDLKKLGDTTHLCGRT